MNKRIHLVISGMVQGVSFRSWSQRTAYSLGLTGWVKNLPDGVVEVVAEGAEEQLMVLIRLCHSGPPNAQVDGVVVHWERATGQEAGFAIQP